MSVLDTVDDKRHFKVGDDQAFRLADNESSVLHSLDDLSEAINLIDPETFQVHVNAEKNDFANWVEHVFGEVELAENLRKYPTPLRMMVSIEKFLRGNHAAAAIQVAPQETAAPASRNVPVTGDEAPEKPTV